MKHLEFLLWMMGVLVVCAVICYFSFGAWKALHNYLHGLD